MPFLCIHINKNNGNHIIIMKIMTSNMLCKVRVKVGL